MESCLKLTKIECNKQQLSVKLQKIDLVLFTNKHKVDNIKMPLLFRFTLTLILRLILITTFLRQNSQFYAPITD